MQVNTIKPNTPGRNRRRVGRGGKRGTYSGRGMKGQKSRSGARIRPAIRDLIKRIPKLRGDSAALPPGDPATPITLTQLGNAFKGGEAVTMKTLAKANLIPAATSAVKIVSGGYAPAKVKVYGVPVTKAAREAIESAGGSVELTTDH